MRLAGRLLNLRQGEAVIVWLMFAYAFLAMTSYNIVKPITRSKFISDLGADNLPYAQLAAGLLIGVLMYGYDRLVARLPPRWGIPVTQTALAAALFGFWPLFLTGQAWASAAFFVFGMMMGVLVISQFWTLANDVFDSRQARRLFGLIGGGASLGGATGATVTRFAVTYLGTDNLLPVSAATLLLCAGLTAALIRRDPPSAGGPAPAKPTKHETSPDDPSALTMLVRSPHLRLIAMLIACASIGAAVIEQQLNMAVASASESLDQATKFLADVTIYLSLAGFLVQIGVTSRLRGSAGLMLALLLLPGSLGMTAVVILLSGALWAPVVARVLDASLRYSVDKTTREVLFLPLPADLKHRAKPFVDVTMDRIARALGAITLLVLIKPWGLGLGWRELSLVSLAVMVIWIALALVARREYLRAFRRSLGAREIEPAALRFDVADAETTATLVNDLSSPDDATVLYAVDVLETLDRRHLVSPLLLQHQSPRVRARALDALADRTLSSDADAVMPVVERLMSDADAGVRAAALRAAVSLRAPEDAVLMRRFLDDAAPPVSVAAAVQLAGSANPDDVLAAEAALTRAIADPRPEAAPDRRAAAQALGRIHHSAFRTMLVPLLHDDDPTVARTAIVSARTIGSGEALYVPALLSRLGDRALKEAARATLAGYGEGITGLLAHVMHDPHEHVWVRRHVPATLARIPTHASMDALVAALDERDGFLRYKALVAIEALRRTHPSLQFDPAVVTAQVLRETSRYYGHLTLRHNLVVGDPASASTLLVRALDDKLARTLDRVFRLLGLAYGWTDVAAARYSLTRGDARARAGALEYLDHLMHGDIRRRVLPILDSTTPEEKVRHANSVLKSRPRDLADTLAQLIHDDDPVVAAAAIHSVVARGAAAGFHDDIAFVAAHRETDRIAHEAATWALDAAASRWPRVEIANRIRVIPVFALVSADELFRIADATRPVAWPAGAALFERGAPADTVLLLVDGTVREADDAGETDESAPAALCLADAIEGRARRRSGRTTTASAGLVLETSALLAMLTDNIAMAQGLFRTLLASAGALDLASIESTATAADPIPAARGYDRAGSIEPLDIARVLHRTPVFSRATLEHLRDLVAATRDVPLEAGQVLWDARVEPAVYHLLAGSVQIGDDASPAARPGRTIGLAETLAGDALGRRAVVTQPGRALRLDQEALFEVLADHDDLLLGLFAAVLEAGANPDQPAALEVRADGGGAA